MSIAVMKKNFYMDSYGLMKKINSERKENIAMRKTISFFGGTVCLAKKLNADNADVSKWLYGRRLIPLKHAIKIEQLTKGEIKVKDLRPDVYENY
jgi:DNA-binding transcriptional regulator YdaS (Cro superfamily)